MKYKGKYQRSSVKLYKKYLWYCFFLNGIGEEGEQIDYGDDTH